MSRAGLNRAAVVSVAVELVDDGDTTGFADLTLAALASRLGIAVPSLYKHVASLADLRREIRIICVDQLTDVISRASTGLAGKDAIREFAHRYPARYAATQVVAAQVTPGRDDPPDDELAAAGGRAIEVTAAVLRGFDLPPELTIDAIRVIRSSLHGFVVLELGGGFGLPDDLDRSFALLVEMVTVGIERISAETPSSG